MDGGRSAMIKVEKANDARYAADENFALLCSPRPPLALPLKDSFNCCLMEQTYPEIWKMEQVTPLLKVTEPTNFSDF